ncbi:MAG: hypothetical protein FWC62_10075 [Firmicutes bacterium]|nr:hypothetical protein [Bacillota bacterium]
MEQKQITTPEEAVQALALAAHTARQTFCIDEPPLPTLLTKMTWSAEEITLKNNLPASVIDSYYRTVFSEHPTGTPALTKQELHDTRSALLNFLGEDKGERVFDGVNDWDDLLEGMA